MASRSRFLIVEKTTKGKNFSVTVHGNGSDVLAVVADQVMKCADRVKGLRIMNANPFHVVRKKPTPKSAQQAVLLTEPEATQIRG